jgi:hypothetical protein
LVSLKKERSDPFCPDLVLILTGQLHKIHPYAACCLELRSAVRSTASITPYAQALFSASSTKVLGVKGVSFSIVPKKLSETALFQ